MGIYAIWYGSSIPDLPFVTGGQVVVEWEQVEPEQGRYDFSRVTSGLAELAAQGRSATVQINGGRKPAWMFKKVPYHPEKLSHQVKNDEGTLMYWHHAHVKSYVNLLIAFADYLRNSEHRSTVFAVRLNNNAIGTEFTSVPQANRDLDQWIVPPGVIPGLEYSPERAHAYLSVVMQMYAELFAGDVLVLVRNSISDALRTQYLEQFNNGMLGWFHTSSEVEPRHRTRELMYEIFKEYNRHTTIYAESWADAWGHHGAKIDDRWCSPPQWNYWRLLFDLHVGVSAIAVYGRDLGVADTGTYSHNGIEHDDAVAGTDYQHEFWSAFEFAARYAGYHASPTTSPGAWVAFRENHIVLAENGLSAAERTLETFTGDYRFLMERLPDQSVGVSNVGPPDHRFGAWARWLPRGEIMRLALDAEFARRLDGGRVHIRVTYLDDRTGRFGIEGGGGRWTPALRNTGRWKTADLLLNAASFQRDNHAAHIRIRSSVPLTLHMVEVTA